jgi:hypothetical protein
MNRAVPNEVLFVHVALEGTPYEIGRLREVPSLRWAKKRLCWTAITNRCASLKRPR